MLWRPATLTGMTQRVDQFKLLRKIFAAGCESMTFNPRFEVKQEVRRILAGQTDVEVLDLLDVCRNPPAFGKVGYPFPVDYRALIPALRREMALRSLAVGDTVRLNEMIGDVFAEAWRSLFDRTATVGPTTFVGADDRSGRTVHLEIPKVGADSIVQTYQPATGS